KSTGDGGKTSKRAGHLIRIRGDKRNAPLDRPPLCGEQCGDGIGIEGVHGETIQRVGWNGDNAAAADRRCRLVAAPRVQVTWVNPEANQRHSTVGNRVIGQSGNWVIGYRETGDATTTRLLTYPITHLPNDSIVHVARQKRTLTSADAAT